MPAVETCPALLAVQGHRTVGLALLMVDPGFSGSQQIHWLQLLAHTRVPLGGMR
jgi:hypothetical protein